MPSFSTRLLLLASIAGLASAIGRPPRPANWNQTRFQDLGAVANTDMITFSVHLPRQGFQAVADLVRDRADKTSPRYGQWLSAAQLLAITQPFASNFTLLQSWLNRPGVTCRQRPHSFVCNATQAGVQGLFNGNTQIVLKKYKDILTKKVIVRVDPTQVVSLETDLAAMTNGAALNATIHEIVGLVDFPNKFRAKVAMAHQARLERRVAEARAAVAESEEGSSSSSSWLGGLGRRLREFTSSSSSSPVARKLASYWTPIFTLEVLNRLYNMPSTVKDTSGNSYTVAGSTSQPVMAVEYNGDYTSLPNSVMQAYNQQNGVGWASAGVANAIGPYSTGTATFLGETSLDLQLIGSIPYPAPTWVWNDANNAAFSDFADDLLQLNATGQQYPYVVSISWGQSEIYYNGPADIAQEEAAFASLAAIGVTVVVSSGDNGANAQAECVGGPTVNYPCSSAYVTCVGATEPAGSASNSFTALSNPTTSVCQNPPSGLKCYQPQSEVVCSSGDGNGITSGGGFSVLVPNQWWQANAVTSFWNTANLNYVPTPYGKTYTQMRSMRMVPDISANGAAYYIQDWNGQCANGQPCIEDGTSASAPVIASIFALANSIRAAAGSGPLGFVTPLLYQMYAQYNSSGQIFNDIVQGNNRCLEQGSQAVNCPSSCVGYYAQAGYDVVTGLGTPNINGLLTALLGATPPVVPPYSWVPPADSTGLSTSAIVGIVVGCILLLCIIGCGIACCCTNFGSKQGRVVDDSVKPPHGRVAPGSAFTYSQQGGYPIQQYAPYGPQQSKGYGV